MSKLVSVISNPFGYSSDINASNWYISARSVLYSLWRYIYSKLTKLAAGRVAIQLPSENATPNATNSWVKSNITRFRPSNRVVADMGKMEFLIFGRIIRIFGNISLRISQIEELTNLRQVSQNLREIECRPSCKTSASPPEIGAVSRPLSRPLHLHPPSFYTAPYIYLGCIYGVPERLWVSSKSMLFE